MLVASSGSTGGVVIVFLALGLFSLWALIDSIVKPDWAYRAAGTSKALWIILIILIGFIGALIYALGPRRRIVQAQRGNVMRPGGPGPSGGSGGGWPGAPAPTQPAGWYPDPSGRFQKRWWDGTRWTQNVSTNGAGYTDPVV